ncbi:MAG: hypothetical protein ACI4OW_05930 [Alphaproteobacteria bacterium]
MFYDLRKILCSTAIALIWGFGSGQEAYAQGTVTLAEETPQISDNNNDNDNFLGVDASIPDEIALFETNNSDEDSAPEPSDGLINPTGSMMDVPQNDFDANTLDTPAMPDMEAPADDAPISLPAPNEQDENSTESTQESLQTVPAVDTSGDILLNQIDNELFTQMSDLEKQTALLTLELRREKIRNEIEALKAQRQKALDEVKAKEEEKERKKLEWEKEQERKLLQEKQKLKEISLALEKLRQEKILNAYKESMLFSTQEWIKNNEGIYEEVSKLEKEKENQINDFKKKINYLSTLAAKTNKDAETAQANYKREIANLQTQISILKARLEAEIAEKEKSKANPFAQAATERGATQAAVKEVVVKLPEEYAVMEIIGKGDALAAKLINKKGDSFLVRKGTSLQTGHVIDEITQTYVRAEKDGMKDYLYFAAGGILEKEPIQPVVKKDKDKDKKSSTNEEGSNVQVSDGIPSLGRGMFVR